MGQAVGRVALELDAFLEVHQVKLHLLGAAPQRQVGDDDVEQGGLARAGLARNQRVLAGSLAQGEVLELGRAGAPDRDKQLFGGVLAPNLRGRRRHMREGHLDPAGIAAAHAHPVHELDGELRRRRRLQFQADARPGRAGKAEDSPAAAGGLGPAGVSARPVIPGDRRGLGARGQAAVRNGAQADAVGAQFLRDELGRQRQPPVPMNQRINAAARPAGRDAQQAFGGGFREVRREVGHDEEIILFRNDPRLLVVFGDGGIFIAQVHLDDLLHVLIEVGQFLLDLARLGPDAAVDELRFVVGQVHDAGEVLPQPHRVNDGEVQPPGRGGGQQPQQEVVQRANGFVAALLGRLEQD